MTKYRSDDVVSRTITELKAQQENNDFENAHILADNALCELLRALGHSDVVEEYLKVHREFA